MLPVVVAAPCTDGEVRRPTSSWAPAPANLTFVSAGIDVAFDGLELFGGIDGTHVRVLVEWIADPKRLHAVGELVGDFIRDGFLDEESRSGAADVPLIEPDRRDDAFDRLIDGCICEDDVRAFSTQFQGELLAGSRNHLRQSLADLR